MALAVVRELEALPDEDWVGRLRGFPEDSCEYASWVVGGILADLGFGDGVMVARADATGSERHVWLELRGEAAEVRCTVDVSIHQFDGFTGPVCGRGTLAAHERWSVSEWEVPMSTRERRYAHRVFAEPLARVRERLLGSTPGPTSAGRGR